MEVQLHQTREAWLNYVAQRMAPIFDQLRAPLPPQLRVAIGFTSGGQRSKNIGECWIISAARIAISRSSFGPT
jgi:hypothetical protein